MKQLFSRWRSVLVALSLTGAMLPAHGQQPINLPNRTFKTFECYDNAALTRTSKSKTTQPARSGYNPNGQDITPRGDLRVLIIYAGFTNDVNLASPDYRSPSWPQEDITHPVPGTTFPANAGGGFYTSISQFSTSATDQTLSNFYYQMSQFSTSPLRMYATIFPKRINITADDATSLPFQPGSGVGGGFEVYTNQVMAALQSDPDTRNFDFSQVDNRTNHPNFQFDNSVTAADHVVDYAIVV